MTGDGGGEAAWAAQAPTRYPEGHRRYEARWGPGLHLGDRLSLRVSGRNVWPGPPPSCSQEWELVGSGWMGCLSLPEQQCGMWAWEGRCLLCPCQLLSAPGGRGKESAPNTCRRRSLRSGCSRQRQQGPVGTAGVKGMTGDAMICVFLGERLGP